MTVSDPASSNAPARSVDVLLARLLCVRHPLRCARSFYGVIDLRAVLPTCLAVLVPGLHVLIDVRVLGLLRIFRILSSRRQCGRVRGRRAQPGGPAGARSWSS